MSQKLPKAQVSSADRYYMILLTALAVATIVLQALSMGPLRNSFWGFHLHAFLPVPFAIVGWAILMLAVIALWRPISRKTTLGTQIIHRYPIVSAVVLAAVCALFFWIFRSDQLLLGDAHPLTVDLPKGQSFHPRQPGTMWLQQFLYQRLGPLFGGEGIADHDVARSTVAAGSVFAGFLFVLVAFGIGRSLTGEGNKNKAVPWLVTAVLLTQGYSLLFFGYIENYTFYALLVGMYLLAALLHLRGGLTLQMASLVFLVSLTVHLSTIGLLPSLLFLMVRGVVRRETRLDALTAIGVFVAGLFLVDWAIRAMSPDFGLVSGVTGIVKIARTSQGGGAGISYWFTPLHIRDFLNEHFQIGPLAALLLVPAAIYAIRRRGPLAATGIFLLLSSLSYLAGSFTMSEPALGYARDWDLFAPAGVCYTTAGLYFLLQHIKGGQKAKAILGFAVVFSLLQLLPWVRINHSEALSLERFKTLPLGYGRTEVVIANYYLRREQYDESMRWLQKAVQVYPRNANAYNLLASISIEREDYERAREAYIRAVALRPDKIEFRHNFTFLLLHMERHEEALPELRWLVERAPETTRYWQLLREVLTELEGLEELRTVNEKLVEIYDRALVARPNDLDLIQDAGIILSDLGRHEEAIERFNRALEIDPTSAAALFNIASALGRMGQKDAARSYLERFVQLHPDHEMADWARRRITEMSQ